MNDLHSNAIYKSARYNPKDNGNVVINIALGNDISHEQSIYYLTSNQKNDLTTDKKYVLIDKLCYWRK